MARRSEARANGGHAASEGKRGHLRHEPFRRQVPLAY
jgi:hypothetical protein